MNKYKLNIGLENNNFNKVVETLNNFRSYGFMDNYYIHRIDKGIYNGESEETIVLTINTNLSFNDMINFTEILCSKLGQDCIPFLDLLTGLNILVYDKLYKGEKQMFNFKYFLK